MMLESSISISCLRSSASSGCGILYSAHAGGFVPRTNSISWPITLLGKNVLSTCFHHVFEFLKQPFNRLCYQSKCFLTSYQWKCVEYIVLCHFLPFFTCTTKRFILMDFATTAWILQELLPKTISVLSYMAIRKSHNNSNSMISSKSSISTTEKLVCVVNKPASTMITLPFLW